MRVLFDASCLGVAAAGPSQRTGIFRAVERTAIALAERRDIELRFSAFASLRMNVHASRYLKAHHELSAVEGPSPLPARRVAEAVVDLYEAGSAQAPLPTRTRIKNRASSAMERFLRLAYGPYMRRVLEGTDVAHSPAGPLPREVMRRVRASFVTIYDMSPFVAPQYHRDWGREFVGSTVECLDRGAWALCISEATRRDLLDFRPRLDPARACVAYLAADERFRPVTDDEALRSVRARYKLGDAPFFLCLNTLEPRKNVDAVIRCFAKIAADPKIGDARLVLAGPRGWMIEGIDAAVSRFPGVREKIVFTGFVDDDDLPALYSAARAFVYVSHYEGFGLPPLEAMQCGTPVITSNVSSLPEIVGDAAIQVPPKDDDRICQAMLDVWCDEERRASLREKGIARAKTFSWARGADQTIDAYRRALSS